MFNKLTISFYSSSTPKILPFLSPYINSGWLKLNKYYNKMGHTPVYVAAVVVVGA